MTYRLLLIMSLLLATWLNPPSASATPRSLHDLRRSLTHYDLEGGTVQVLSEIGAQLPRSKGMAHHERRFLRAAVAADLLIIATLHDNAALYGAVAQALETTPEDLPQVLDRELAAARGPYRAPALEARRALAALEADDYATASKVAGTHGDMLRLRILARIAREHDDPAPTLAELGSDPCPKGSCPPAYRGLEANDRRGVATLMRGAEAIERLRRAARHGDPFSRALGDEIEEASTALRAISLEPTPTIPPAMDLTTAEHARPLSPDLVLLVGPDSVRYSFVPRIRLAEGGELKRFAAAEPMLPELERLPLPSNFRPYMTPIRSVSKLLAHVEAENDPTLTVAVGASGDVRAHVLARVLLSLRRAGRDRAWVLGRNDAGFARAAQVTMVSKRNDDLQRSKLRVRVRLGGYSLHAGNRYQDIPRIRDEDGLRFDLQTLQQRLQRHQVPRADVSFMANVASENFIPAIFSVAGRADTVRLVLP